LKHSLTLNLSVDQHLWLENHSKRLDLSPEAALLRWIDEQRGASLSSETLDLFGVPVAPAKSAPARLRLPDSYQERPVTAVPDKTAVATAPVKAARDAAWKIWSDGACSGNPGPGGWGTIVEGPQGREEFSGGFRNTTNNRMEMMGAIIGLEAIPKGERVVLTTDSRYIVDAIEKKWLAGWKRKGWRKADGGAVANVDLWQMMEAAMGGKFVQFEWVRGHNGHSENERCDVLAVEASHRKDLPPDPK